MNKQEQQELERNKRFEVLFEQKFYSQKNEESIRQGDVIDLKKFKRNYNKANQENKLEYMYGYFFDTYKYAVVTTQCCDLECRGGRKLNVRCIEFVALKPVKQVMKEVIERTNALIMNTTGETVVYKKNKDEDIVKNMLNLLNHNTKIHFYYPSNNEFPEQMVACLDNPISLRLDGIYREVLGARIKSIEDSYRHKLAHTKGLLYSRVGLDTHDEISGMTKKQFSNFILYSLARNGIVPEA